METSDSFSPEVRISPSVSKEKWAVHAKTKLANGYILIVSDLRRNANFFRAGKGYETCAYNVALQLVREGSVTKAYDHHLGTAYLLSPDAHTQPVAAKKKAQEEEAADTELLLAHIVDTDSNNSSSVDTF